MPVRNCRLGPWRLKEWLQSRVVQENEIACYENLKFNDDGGAPLGKFGDEWVRTSRRTLLMCNLLHFQPIKFPLRAMRHNVSRLKTVYKSKLVDWHLDEEIQLVVLEKNGFSSKKHHTCAIFVGDFGISTLHWKNGGARYEKRITFCKNTSFKWDVDLRNPDGCSEKNRVWLSRSIIRICSYWLFRPVMFPLRKTNWTVE